MHRIDIFTDNVGADKYTNTVTTTFGDGFVLVGDNAVNAPDIQAEQLLILRETFGDEFTPNTFNGDIFSDRVIGGNASDTLNGGGGNDTLNAGLSFDTLSGGSGNDQLEGGADTDQIAGGDGNDRIFSFTADNPGGGTGGDFLQGEDGDDLIMGGGGFENLSGGSGNDTLDGGTRDDTMIGGAGNDLFIIDSVNDVINETGGTTGGIDTVQTSFAFTLAESFENLTLTGAGSMDGTGNAAANRLTGNDGANVLSGLDGNDTLFGGLGEDSLVGGNGIDTADWSAATGNMIVLLFGDQSVGTGLIEGTGNVPGIGSDSASGIENMICGSGDDVMSGNTAANALSGGGGNDQVFGSGGADTLLGGDGNDTLTGGAGDDTLNGGAGTDTADWSAASSGIVATIGAQGQGSFTDAGIGQGRFAGIESIIGSGQADLVTGNALANAFSGRQGNDSFAGGGGDDRLLGEEGNDQLLGGLGNDQLDGGAGSDTLTGGRGNDIYVVNGASDRIAEAANGGLDTVLSSRTRILDSNVEKLVLTGGQSINGTGNKLANELTGNGVANTLNGLGGADTMRGGGGDDVYIVNAASDRTIEVAGGGIDLVRSSVTHTLPLEVENLTLAGNRALNGVGNELANVLSGNGAANRLSGGLGADTLTGGGGRDFFDFNSIAESGTTNSTQDVIIDFTQGVDRVDLITIDASAAVTGNQNFSFIGTAAFSAAGQLRFLQQNGNTIVELNTVGTGGAEMQIRLSGLFALTAADFV